MEIKLINEIPVLDGYYLMKFNKTGGLHLVLIQTELDGARVIHPDNLKKGSEPIKLGLAHSIVFKEALFSEKPIKIIV